ncbi:synaptojanin-1 [Condylostylus longicornis]|uniref:synaptojanin-1 n=1 Tax=Condylostylus longicornis TaxID=2530218 RepID=UPI00244E38F0|nr:synaptojanin-1 [Condylostylus longicornis]
MALSKSIRVLEKSQAPNPYSILLEDRQKPESLLFESQVVALLSQQEAEQIKKQYTKVCDAYGCLGVLQVNNIETTLLYLVLVTGVSSVGKINEIEIFRITQTQFVPLQIETSQENKTSEVRKVLNSGTFYFAHTNPSSNETSTFEITLCAQRRQRTEKTDNRFFWNRMLHIHLLRFDIDCDAWLLKVMCGSIEIRTVYVGSKQARAAVISRLSCERAGTRFNVRGTNDDGHVANFVETEQVIYLDNQITSFVQTRGSVPLFWEQPGIQVGSHKVKISRGFEASISAFEKHMQIMKTQYGQFAIVNLLGTSLVGSKEGEATLSMEFQKHHNESKYIEVPHIIFDYHQECRGGNTAALSKLKAKIEECQAYYGLFHVNGKEVLEEQIGTIRTNCLDCLDRTNCVQTFFGLDSLKDQIIALGLADKKQSISRFEEIFTQMWINNGNEISKIYAGTGAIQGGSKIMDGARSAARTIQNNLLDSSKQEAIDILLVGSTLSSEPADIARTLLPLNMLHAPTPVLREMCKRHKSFVKNKQMRVAVCTYNVNGGKHFRSVAYKDSLDDWLLASQYFRRGSLIDVTDESESEVPIDVYAIGFQEIVDLNTSNIVASSTENAKIWAEELLRTLCNHDPYVLLTYQQLVGVCLYVYIRTEYASAVRDLAIDWVKTGLGGATGNKGATAIRFTLYGTSVCFVCSHFAAGQSQVAERNADFSEITKKLSFGMGRTLKTHDYIFWCGDFNYRIDMDKEELKEAIRNKEYKKIFEQDQLRKEQEAGNVFNDFLEGEITFDPTYKYDLFSEDYDTSEKMRAPAYTDRVFWNKKKSMLFAMDEIDDWNPGKLIYYGRCELKQSDHRPVTAVLDIDIAEIDTEKRNEVFKEVISDLGPPDATIVVHVQNEENEENLSIYDENVMSGVIKELSQMGEITLVRYVENTMWVTFREGESALKVVNKKFNQICGLDLIFQLKTENWVSQVEREISLFTTNTVALSNYKKTPEKKMGTPQIPKRPNQPPARPPAPNQPPSRPPLPKSPKMLPHAGVISNPSNIINNLNTVSKINPSAENEKPVENIDIQNEASHENFVGDSNKPLENSEDKEKSNGDNKPPNMPPPPLPSNYVDSVQQPPENQREVKLGAPPPIPNRNNTTPVKTAPAIPNRGPPPPLPPR